jgi:hypothetical protein
MVTFSEFDMDNYDKEEVDDDGEKVTMFGNVQSLAYHQPLLTPLNRCHWLLRSSLQYLPP